MVHLCFPETWVCEITSGKYFYVPGVQRVWALVCLFLRHFFHWCLFFVLFIWPRYNSSDLQVWDQSKRKWKGLISDQRAPLLQTDRSSSSLQGQKTLVFAFVAAEQFSLSVPVCIAHTTGVWSKGKCKHQILGSGDFGVFSDVSVKKYLEFPQFSAELTQTQCVMIHAKLQQWTAGKCWNWFLYVKGFDAVILSSSESQQQRSKFSLCAYAWLPSAA